MADEPQQDEWQARVLYELRTGMHNIIGYSQLTLEGNFGQVSPALQEIFHRNLEICRRLLSVLTP